MSIISEDKSCFFHNLFDRIIAFDARVQKIFRNLTWLGD
jgi:hypothetical protein